MSFLTGSYAYGTPKPESDIDLVILVTASEANKLAGMIIQEDAVLQDYYGRTKTHSLRFGKLNLLVCTTKEKYLEWHRGTRLLKQDAPVLRDTAVDMFSEIFEKGLIEKELEEEATYAM